MREIVLYKSHLTTIEYIDNHTSVLMPHGTKDLCLHAVVWWIALAHERRMRDWSVNATAGALDWLPGIVYATTGVKSEVSRDAPYGARRTTGTTIRTRHATLVGCTERIDARVCHASAKRFRRLKLCRLLLSSEICFVNMWSDDMLGGFSLVWDARSREESIGFALSVLLPQG